MKHLLAVCPFVVNEEVRQVVPHLTVLVQVGHGGLQGGLQGLLVVFKEPQDCPPHQGSHEREGILLGLWDVALFHSQPRQTEQDPGQQVHDDLQEEKPREQGVSTEHSQLQGFRTDNPAKRGGNNSPTSKQAGCNFPYQQAAKPRVFVSSPRPQSPAALIQQSTGCTSATHPCSCTTFVFAQLMPPQMVLMEQSQSSPAKQV